MTKLLLILFLCSPVLAERKDMNELIDKLIPALIQVESGGDPDAVGDNGEAVGILQIHKCVVDDVNDMLEKDDRLGAFYDERFIPKTSETLCRLYLSIYGHNYEIKTHKKPTLEVLARIWNGGPNGYKKKSTEKYWLKVKKELEK